MQNCRMLQNENICYFFSAIENADGLMRIAERIAAQHSKPKGLSRAGKSFLQISKK